MSAGLHDYLTFLARSVRRAFQGSWRYYAWMTFLTIVVLVGLNAYARQVVGGLSVTGMSDQVSWGAYIANFTYLVGIAAAAVMLVIPAYIYKNEAVHQVVLLGELLAVAALVMCLLFVTVDLGRPDRFWHMIPLLGRFNWPISMLAWDVIALNGYLVLNAHVAGYLIYTRWKGEKPNPRWYLPFVFVSIGWAVSIHTVTAFLYVGLGGRPFWNSAIVAPRFLASAFAAGPGLIVITLQLVRRLWGFDVRDEALMLLRRIITVAMLINLFLLGTEVFTEFYTDSRHVAAAHYLFFGLGGAGKLVPWIWLAIAMNLVATVLLMSPKTRSLRWLNLACVFAIVGIWVEKGMGLIVPGFVPSPLGEVVEYAPTLNETLVSMGIWAFGALLYTLMLRVAVPVVLGTMRRAAPPVSPNAGETTP
ncbi:MAG: polysulfide reductase NrfD [Myxococcales bacterium]|nr:polysulfide reductase NrfD [Myxococcales bacterium]